MQVTLLPPQGLPDQVKQYLGKFDLNLCLTCGTCSGGCPVSGTPGYEGLNTRKVLRMLALGMLDEVVESVFPWLCTGCGRCVHACPMGIDIVAIMGYMKSLRPRDKVPGILHKGVLNVLASGNNMAIPQGGLLLPDVRHGAANSPRRMSRILRPHRQGQCGHSLLSPTPRKSFPTTTTCSGGGRFFTRQKKTGPFLPKTGKPLTGVCSPETLRPRRSWPEEKNRFHETAQHRPDDNARLRRRVLRLPQRHERVRAGGPKQ